MHLFYHPLYLLALIMLILNDHILKFWSPSVITGKLSDIAGLFLVTVYGFILSRKLFKDRTALLVNLLLVSGVFTLIQLTPADEWGHSIAALLSLPEPHITPDKTDLLALAVIPFGIMFIRKYANSKDKMTLPLTGTTRYLAGLICIVSTLAIAATSFPRPPGYLINKDIDVFLDEAKTLYVFEQTLMENEFTIIDRTEIGSKDNQLYSYIVSFQYTPPDSILDNEEETKVEAELLLSTRSDPGVVKLESVIFKRQSIYLDRTTVDEIIDQRIMMPLKQKSETR